MSCKNFTFTCPSCGKSQGIDEVAACDGVTSEVIGLDALGNIEYGESQGHGDVYDVTYVCAACGEEIEVEGNASDLVALGFVTLTAPISMTLKMTFKLPNIGDVTEIVNPMDFKQITGPVLGGFLPVGYRVEVVEVTPQTVSAKVLTGGDAVGQIVTYDAFTFLQAIRKFDVA